MKFYNKESSMNEKLSQRFDILCQVTNGDLGVTLRPALLALNMADSERLSITKMRRYLRDHYEFDADKDLDKEAFLESFSKWEKSQWLENNKRKLDK